MNKALLSIFLYLLSTSSYAQTNASGLDVSPRDRKWLERNGVDSVNLSQATDSVNAHLSAALKYHRSSVKFLKYGGIGAAAGIATIVVGETYLADPTWLYAGVITAYSGVLTGIIGGSIANAKAKHELGSAIALLSFPASLQAENIGFELQPTEYAWITKNGFDIYTYEWDDKETNRLVAKAVRGCRRSAAFWKYGSLAMVGGVVATAIAIREGAYGVAYRIILPVYVVQLTTVLGGFTSKELALSRARQAAQRRPLSSFRSPG